MIDFGLVNKYLDKSGTHIKEGTPDKFRGYFLFAGLNAFKFYSSCRKDDLVSLVYVLIFMLDFKRLTFINQIKNKNRQEILTLITDAKFKLGPAELCGKSLEESRAFHIYRFVDEIYSY